MIIPVELRERARKALYCRIPTNYREADIKLCFTSAKILWINTQSCLVFVDRPQRWVGDAVAHYGAMHVKRFLADESNECLIRDIPPSFWVTFAAKMTALDAPSGRAEPVQIAYWRGVLDATEPACNPPLTIITLGDKLPIVVSDHELVGGTKYRALVPMMAGETGFDEFVYAGPVYGYAQLALARAAQTTGKKATLFVEEVRPRHPITTAAINFGATVIETRNGHLARVQELAQQHVAASKSRFLVPFGVHCPQFMWLLTEQLRLVTADIEAPKRVWVAAGSGTIMQVLHNLWPEAVFMIVQVGKFIRDETVSGIKHQLFRADESFPEVARKPPPFPSASNYDAKVWQFVVAQGRPGDVFWSM